MENFHPEKPLYYHAFGGIYHVEVVEDKSTPDVSSYRLKILEVVKTPSRKQHGKIKKIAPFEVEEVVSCRKLSVDPSKWTLNNNPNYFNSTWSRLRRNGKPKPGWQLKKEYTERYGSDNGNKNGRPSNGSRNGNGPLILGLNLSTLEDSLAELVAGDS